MSDAPSASTAARILVRSLADAGVDCVVVSPGSRSTPLVWQILDEPRLRAVSIVDERDAAFWAVGRGKISGRPTAIVCTSGSAAANYLPAIVEAALSSTPLIVITADRPLELQQAGAPQTIDQVKLYGGYARHFAEVDLADDSVDALRAMRRVAAQAVHAASGEHPGPVHVNARARKPLEPSPDIGEDRAAATILEAPLARADRPRRLPSTAAVARFAEAARVARRPLIVCGPMALAETPSASVVRTLAERLGAGIFAEATSGLRFALGADAPLASGWGTLARSSRSARSRPDLVIQIGITPTSAGYATMLQSAPARFVVTSSGWMDPQNAATEILTGDIEASLAALVDAVPSGTHAGSWLHELCAEDGFAWSVVDDELAAEGFGELSAVRRVVDALAPGSLLAVGNSLPVREVDLCCRAADRDLSVWSQRGASGIDGLVAGAAGAADASGRPTTLLLGDVSLLHDLGGLAVAAACRVPLRIVVLHNGGGRIFEQLPIGRRSDVPRGSIALWTTPHAHRFGPLAEQFGIPYNHVETHDELGGALARAKDGPSLIEVRVPDDSARRGLAAILARLDAPRDGAR